MPATLPTDHPLHYESVRARLDQVREADLLTWAKQADKDLTFNAGQWETIMARVHARGFTSERFTQYLRQLIIDDAGL